MAKINKDRKYFAVYDKKSGKFYTGWDGSIVSEPYILRGVEHDAREVLEKVHSPQCLEIQYCGYGKGRSAANLYFEDRDGYQYEMGMKGFDLLMRLMNRPSSEIEEKYDIKHKRNTPEDGSWITGTFCQTKQGAQYFIETMEL